MIRQRYLRAFERAERAESSHRSTAVRRWLVVLEYWRMLSAAERETIQ